MPNSAFAVRLTCAFDLLDLVYPECEGSFLDYLENRGFETVIVYQHKEAANTHCHLLLIAETALISADSIKKSQYFKNLSLGNRQHSFKSKFKDPTGVIHDISVHNCGKYITYMTKGKLNPEHVSLAGRYTYSECKELKDDWVQHTKSKTFTQVEAFEKHLKGDKWDAVRDTMVHPYNWLKGKVMSYIMAKYDGFDHCAKNEYCMLLITFSYKYAYDPPEKSKQWI